MAKKDIKQDDYWMSMAFMAAALSKSSLQQGAVIVGADQSLLAFCCDDDLIHAEIKALLQTSFRAYTNPTIYITHTPCKSCLTAIIAAKIKRIVYFQTETLEEELIPLIQNFNLICEEFKGNLNWIRDYMKILEGQHIFRGE